MERKLAAVVVGDVAGYSRLMGVDEVGTMTTWSVYRKEIISPLVESFQGRLIKLTGDGFFAEFPSAVGAVECSVAIQNELAQKNSGLPAERQIRLRIGINLCDLLAEDGDIYGDGVNIAARVEKLAAPGGICVTAAIYDQVHKHLKLVYENIGEQRVKNIATPVRAYRVNIGSSGSGWITRFKNIVSLKGYRRPIWFGAAAGLLLAGVGLAWTFYPGIWQLPREGGPNIPALLVLPFSNLNDEKQNDYFSDGITEDIIASLTRFPSLRVLSRHASFAHKDESLDYRALMSKTGARYFLEGGVRRQGDSVRLNVRLVDGETGRPRWAERYDASLKDIFKAQDDLTQRVVATLVLRISQSELEKAYRKPPENLEAYELALHGRQKFFEGNKKNISEARNYLARAVTLDPNYAPSYVYLAYTQLAFFLNPWNEEHLNQENLKRIIELTSKAASLEPNYAPAYTFRGVAWAFLNQHELAIRDAKHGISINPNDPDAVFRYGQVLLFSGSPEEASHVLYKAFALDPSLPPQYHTVSARAYILLNRFNEAIAESRYCTERIKFLVCNMNLVIALELGGRAQEAKEEATRLTTLFPKARLESLSQLYSLAYRDKSHTMPAVSALRRAGIPD